VRFGSYHTQPVGQVEFSSEAISLTVPVWKKRGRNGPVEIEFTFPFDNVDDCKIHFSSGLCAIFIEPLVAEEYCKQLGLVDNGRGPYWDPYIAWENRHNDGKKWFVLVLPGSVNTDHKKAILKLMSSYSKSKLWLGFRTMMLIDACAALMENHPSRPKYRPVTPDRKFKRPDNM